MKYAFMTEHADQFCITTMARVLGVARSGYYRWCRGVEPGPRAIARATLDERVREAFHHNKRRYGAPRLTRQLDDQGHAYDDKTIASSLHR